MLRSGIKTLFLALPLALSGCIYGFAGGGLPPHIKSVAVLPFDNETPSPTLQRELHDLLKHEVESRLGLREASESKANAVVRGRIVRYEADIPVAYSSAPSQANTAQRKLQITVDVEIVDESTGRTLWSQKGLMREGTYSERGEDQGRKDAVEKIVNDVIAGAQSQW
jgi:hypothetical protein